MTKDEYIKMLYQRTEYLKSEIADFEQCNGGVEQARLWAIKEQVSRIFGLINECDKELFPDTIRFGKTEQEYLQTCNTEQLAEWICSVREKCYYCGAKQIPDREHCAFGDDFCRINRHEFVEWLKQPHKKE